MPPKIEVNLYAFMAAFLGLGYAGIAFVYIHLMDGVVYGGTMVLYMPEPYYWMLEVTLGMIGLAGLFYMFSEFLVRGMM